MFWSVMQSLKVITACPDMPLVDVEALIKALKRLASYVRGRALKSETSYHERLGLLKLLIQRPPAKPSAAKPSAALLPSGADAKGFVDAGDDRGALGLGIKPADCIHADHEALSDVGDDGADPKLEINPAVAVAQDAHSSSSSSSGSSVTSDQESVAQRAIKRMEIQQALCL